MDANQELYAKSLEIAVLLLGKTNILWNEKQSDFNVKFLKYRDLAKFIADDILNAPH
jgi:hypothetical protein